MPPRTVPAALGSIGIVVLLGIVVLDSNWIRRDSVSLLVREMP